MMNPHEASAYDEATPWSDESEPIESWTLDEVGAFRNFGSGSAGGDEPGY